MAFTKKFKKRRRSGTVRKRKRRFGRTKKIGKISRLWRKALKKRATMTMYKFLGNQIPRVMKVILPRSGLHQRIAPGDGKTYATLKYSMNSPFDINVDGTGLATSEAYAYYADRYRFVTCVGSSFSWEASRCDDNQAAQTAQSEPGFGMVICRTSKAVINQDPLSERYIKPAKSHYFRSTSGTAPTEHWRGKMYASYKSMTGRSPFDLCVSTRSDGKNHEPEEVGNTVNAKGGPLPDRVYWQIWLGTHTVNGAKGIKPTWSVHGHLKYYCVFTEPYGSIESLRPEVKEGTNTEFECPEDPDIGDMADAEIGGEGEGCAEFVPSIITGLQGPQGYQGPA